jgi:hypothetical protein
MAVVENRRANAKDNESKENYAFILEQRSSQPEFTLHQRDFLVNKNFNAGIHLMKSSL